MIKLGKVKDKYFVNCTLIYKYISVISTVVVLNIIRYTKGKVYFAAIL